MDPHNPAMAPSADCIVCGGGNYALKYDFRVAGIWRCLDCGMMMLWPQPSEQGLQAVYSDHYYRNERFLSNSNSTLYGYVDYLSEKRHRRLDMDAIFAAVRSRLDTPADASPSLLEIGCGLGWFLDEAFDRGFTVEGVEFNRFAYDSMRRKYTFPVHFGSVTEAQFGRPQYDVCCMLDVIEHLVSPTQALRRIGGLIRPGGLCVLQTMDSTSLVSRMLGQHLEDFRRIREHLYFFDRSTITRLLAAQGLEVVSIQSIGHSFHLGFLLDRLDMIVPRAFGWIKRVVRPRWLLNTTLYVNPGTKMLVIARKRS